MQSFFLAILSGELTNGIQDEKSWCMPIANDTVFVHETKEGGGQYQIRVAETNTRNSGI